MKLDPRAIMVMVVCITTLALIYNTPGPLLLILAGTTVLLFIFRIDFGAVRGYLRPYLSLLLILLLVQIVFTRGGEVLLAAGSLPLVTSRGLLVGTSVVLRIVVVIAAALLLTRAGSRDFILGLAQWKVPYEVAFMVAVAARFLPVFRDELINVVTAIQLRGVDLKKAPWGQKIELYRRLFFPKAQQLALAMEARGFRAYPRRTYLRRLYLSFADYMVMLFFPAATLALIWLHIY